MPNVRTPVNALFVMFVSALSLTPLAVAQGKSPESASTITFRKPIKFLPPNSGLDDALIELSKSADINLISDADSFFTGGNNMAIGQLGDQQDAFLNVLLKVAHQGKLAWIQSQPSTFLMWGERDNVTLFKKVLSHQSGSLVPETVSPEEFRSELLNYLRTRPDWREPEADGAKRSFSISELPVSLRRHLIAAAQAQFLRMDSTLLNASWLSDEMWSKATLGIGTLKERNRTLRLLDIGSEWRGLGDDATGQLSTRMSFALVDSREID